MRAIEQPITAAGALAVALSRCESAEHRIEQLKDALVEHAALARRSPNEAVRRFGITVVENHALRFMSPEELEIRVAALETIPGE